MKKTIMILMAMFISTMCYSQIEIHKFNELKEKNYFYYIVDTVRCEIHMCVVRKNKKNIEISREIIKNVEEVEKGIYVLLDRKYVVKGDKTPKELVKDIINKE